MTLAADAAVVPATAVYAEAIGAEQTKVIFRYLPPLLVINAFVAAGMVFGLWPVVGHARLLVWLAAMVLVIVLRTALYAAYRRRSARRADPWRTWFTFGSGAAGVLWGLAGVYLFPRDALEYQLFILFILVGMGAGAVSSLTAYLPAFYAFFPVSLLPCSLVLLGIGDHLHVALGVMAIAYVCGLTFFGSTLNRTLVESLSLRFANVDLVQQLSEQRDEAERANIAKSKFLAAASHDLRQPLHALTLFTSALDEHVREAEGRRIAEHIVASVRALEKLFDALLDISRLDAGVLKPQLRHFRLDSLLHRLVNEHTPGAAAKGLHVACEDSGLVVHSDPALLERILRNYLSNAIRYTVRGEVRVRCRRRGETVSVEVLDTGIGIPASQHHAIFQEFHQLENAERDRTKGLGLGLAIVERVARLLGHDVGVMSQPGRGACFSVAVPIGDSAQELAETADGGGDAARELDGLCVVIVDDEAAVREATRTLLRQWGCRVVAAASAEDSAAELRVASLSPGAIVVDYRLPGALTGVDVIERLRAEFGSEIPALIVTGDTAPERLREAKASGHPLMHKPLQPARLRAFLRNTRRRRAREATPQPTLLPP